MDRPYIKVYDRTLLWGMSPVSFNAWRARNDLPILFDYFLQTLPRFQEWLNLFHLSKQHFCYTVPTGTLFRGTGTHHLTDIAIGGVTFFNSSVVGDQPYTYDERNPERRGDQRIAYVPYLIWLKQVERKTRPILIDSVNSSWSDRFEYGAHGVDAAVDTNSPRSFLFRGFPVLKLGDHTIGDLVFLDQRNLDFVDLDHLRIIDKWHGSAFKRVSFSSLWNVEIRNAELYFLELNHCDISELVIVDSKIQDLWFVDSSAYQNSFTTSGLHKIAFINSECGFTFDRCNVTEFVFTPPATMTATRISNNYRQIRTAYQSTGKRSESAQAYFLERQYERRAAWNPYTEHASDFPPELAQFNRRTLRDEYQLGEIGFGRLARDVCRIVLAHFKIWMLPKFSLRALRFKLQWLGLGFQELVWGFGEKPGRVVVSALLIISVYGLLDFHFLNQHLSSNQEPYSLAASVYFSIVTFTTFGAGVPTPDAGVMKVLYGSEAIVGVFLMGLLVGAFANRNRF